MLYNDVLFTGNDFVLNQITEYQKRNMAKAEMKTSTKKLMAPSVLDKSEYSEVEDEEERKNYESATNVTSEKVFLEQKCRMIGVERSPEAMKEKQKRYRFSYKISPNK